MRSRKAGVDDGFEVRDSSCDPLLDGKDVDDNDDETDADDEAEEKDDDEKGIDEC